MTPLATRREPGRPATVRISRLLVAQRAGNRALSRYDWRMKTSYLFVAILLLNVAAVAVGGRGLRTVLSLCSAGLAGYGIFRLLG